MAMPRKPVPFVRRSVALHPSGTARALFLGEEGAPAAAAPPELPSGARAGGGSIDPLPRGLWEHVRAHDVDPGTLLGAWEAASWSASGPASPAASVEARALAILLVALGEALDAGSSFLPLGPGALGTGARANTHGAAAAHEDGEDDPGLDAWLDRLALPARERTATLALARALATGTAPPAVAALFGPPGSRRPFILDGAALYSEAAWTFEARLAEALRPRIAGGPHPLAPGVEEALAHLGGPSLAAGSSARGAPPRPSDEQLAALRACLTNPLTLVTGGPGTGKTSIIVGLLRALAHLGVAADAIAVAAPTGRAAHRIEETIGRAGLDLGPGWAGVMTVHRLLGLRGERRPTLDTETPEHHAGWRLPHRIVICDEASMIDLFMMTEVVSALGDGAHLVLLGDVDQLPSVRLGAAFRDLCLALPGLTCRLTASHRMDPGDPAGAEILSVAAAVRAGALGTPPPLRARAADLAGVGVERLPRARLPDLLDRWYDEVLGGDAALGAIFERPLIFREGQGLDAADTTAVSAALQRHRTARLLCITRAADQASGADALNQLFHRRVERALEALAAAIGPAGADARGGAGREPDSTGEAERSSREAADDDGPGGRPDLAFLPGEPVMILRNDYERELWNGDQGLVVRLAATRSRPATRGVAFARGDGVVVHLLDEIADNLGLAFALTVHKAQGSEYERIALVLPSIDGPLLTREILYTALTRARRSVVVVGDAGLLALGISRRLRRASGLAAKLGLP